MSHTEDCDDPETCKQFECDVCRQMVQRCRIARVSAYGIETYACGECRGDHAAQRYVVNQTSTRNCW
jgi:hypothetical protein